MNEKKKQSVELNSHKEYHRHFSSTEGFRNKRHKDNVIWIVLCIYFCTRVTTGEWLGHIQRTAVHTYGIMYRACWLDMFLKYVTIERVDLLSHFDQGSQKLFSRIAPHEIFPHHT